MVSATVCESDEVTTNGNATINTWLTEEFYKDILDKEFGKYEIVNFQVSNATAKGENYASVMNRISIDLKLEDGTDKTMKFIVKSMVQSENAGNMLGSMSVFPKEIEMYEEIMPEMTKMYEDAGVKNPIGVKCYKTQQNPSVIVLEDLGVDGYENINRLEGMDIKHAEATLQKLAKFHAATARMYELNGPFSDQFKYGIFRPELLAMMIPMFEAQWPLLSECVRQWGDCEKYLENIQMTPANVNQRFLDVEEMNPDEFNVLNHGDMWSNNVMFKHTDDGSIEDLKFVDLQMCKWGSPVLDLQYFIVTSCSYDIRIAKYDYFVRYYHEHLIENLKLIKYQGKLPKLMDLQIQMLKRGYYSINIAFGTLMAVLLDPSDGTDMEMFLNNSVEATAFKKKIFMNPRYFNAVKSILEFAENRGILE